MAAMTSLQVFDRLIDYLIEKATPQEILAFELSPEDQEHVQELIFRNSADTITPEEKLELEKMAEFDLFVTVLKAKALKALKQS